MRLLDAPLGLLINFHESRLVNGIHRLILAGADSNAFPEGKGEDRVEL